MKRFSPVAWGLCLSPFLVTGVVADALWLENPKLKVRPAVALKATAFDLRDVHLLDGPFKHAMELDRNYLLLLEPDRLLHTFRLNAGLASTAEPLGGWEEPKGELRGHFTGHYLSACALMYASTGDERVKRKGDEIVAGLAACQAKIGSGYLSAYPEEFFDRVEKRQRVWAPYYTLHKLYAGLLDMYVHGDNAQALEVCRKFADWVIARNDRLTEEQMQKMLGEEHGGMNECLANLYALTGDEKYLRISRRFNHQAVIGPTANREDKLTGLHANTQIPKFVGTARQYALTGDESLKTASTFFWDTVVKERSYVIGGHSDGEMFTPKEKLSTALGPNTTETCNTYNMLKLTRHLFSWDPRVAYADYYERALYNHILASQHPESGMMCYYVPLRSGMARGSSSHGYNTPLHSFWCCTGTGVENHAKYGDSIYFHDGAGTLFVNLFIASELDWKVNGVKVRQETRYPEVADTRLVFTCAKPVDLVVNLRRPGWTTGDFEVRVNGRKQKVPARSASWVALKRKWKTGDVVEVKMPFALRTEGFRDNPRRFAFLNGPLVLCAEVDPKRTLPAVVAQEGGLLASLTPVSHRPNTFAGSPDIFRSPGGGSDKRIVLEPFYQVHGARPYVVYFDSFAEEQWRGKEQEYRVELARRREFETRTVDYVLPDNPQNERDHNLKGERTGAGGFGERNYRHATDGGWFSWDLKVQPGQAQELWVTYWGSDGGNRVFDILIDGVKLTTQRLERNRPEKFYDEIHPLPAAMTEGKDKVTVKFQAQPGAWAGGVFGIRIMKPAIVP